MSLIEYMSVFRIGPQWVGDPDRHQPQVPRHDLVFVEGQVPDRLEADQGGRPVRLPAEAPDWPRTLRLRRRPLLRRTLCPLGVVGPHPQALGLGYRILHSQVAHTLIFFCI